MSEKTVDNIQAAFQSSLHNSIRHASRELQSPKSTIYKVLHKRLRFDPYKLQIVQALQLNERPRRFELAAFMLQKIEEDDKRLERLMFSEESTFFVSERVNHHNVWIWSSEYLHTTHNHIGDCPKVNVWCALMHKNVIGRFFFAEKNIA